MKRIINIIAFCLFGILMFSCNGEKGVNFFKPNRVEPPSIEDRVSASNAENLGRSSWQKPALIVKQLGDIEGKTVADIGAGTGYFTFHLAYMKAHVIAIDIDPMMTQYIDTYKKKLPVDLIPQIETRLADVDDPKVKDKELDAAIIVNTASYIDHFADYLKNLKPAFKQNGRLVIVDYKNANIDIAIPPQEQLIPIDLMEEYLIQAGYTNVLVDDTSLKFQYIVTADIP